MIVARDVFKFFDGAAALNGVTVSIRSGSVYGLIGTNGSGKSTLLRLLAGVYRPDQGGLDVDGTPVFENVSLKERIFFVSDDFYFFPNASMNDMAAFFSKMYTHWSWERYRSICGMFPVGRTEKLACLSKGMQRQAALALGLSAQPDYLLLDESFDGLDPVLRAALRKILVDDVARRGVTVVVSSHNLRDLEDMCDHVGLLHQGVLVFHKELDELKVGFCKVQAAFRPVPDPDKLRAAFDLASISIQGSLVNMTVRGSREQALSKLQDFNPLFAEGLPLTLEEVFTNEMEAIGYDYHNVLF